MITFGWRPSEKGAVSGGMGKGNVGGGVRWGGCKVAYRESLDLEVWEAILPILRALARAAARG